MDKERREIRRAKILAGANDRLSKITAVYNASSSTSTDAASTPKEGKSSTSGDTSSLHINNPLLQSPSVVRTPERPHASTVSRSSLVSTPQGTTREFADSLASEGEFNEFPDPPDMLPAGVSPDVATSLDDERMARMMQAMMNAMKNNNPNMARMGSNDSQNENRQAPGTFTDNIPPIPNLQQQAAQQKTGVSVRLWKLIHMISISVLAVWALYNFATAPTNGLDEELYDSEVEWGPLSPWQKAVMRLGQLAFGESSRTISVTEGVSIWMLFLTIEISLQVIWFAYQSMYPDPPSPPTLWSEITSLHPTLATVTKVVSDYRMVFSSIIEDICTFLFIMGIAVLISRLSMPEIAHADV